MKFNKTILPNLFLIIAFAFISATVASGSGKSSGLVAPGAMLKTVQAGFEGTEGPATDAEGNVWFTEVFGQKINKWTWKDGKIALYRENTGKANGMMFDSSGNPVICEMGNVWSYKINSDCTLSNKKIFCEKTTDGMAMDENSNVYLTSGRFILVYSPAGELIGEIAVPEGCSNVEFGGKDRKTLFITYMGYIYTLDMAVKGCQLPIDLGKGKK